MMMNALNKTLLSVSVALGLSACASVKTADTYDLDFSKQKYTEQSIEVNGQAVKFRAYEGVVYVRNPVDTRYEIINIYVPEAYYNGGEIDGFNAETAPIFLPNQIGGYMPAEPGKPALEGKRGEPEDSQKSPNAALVALSKGYVVASPGARGRTEPTGKEPAAIVDLKAAVRYLKANDKVMPGDAEKIISNGTSAGGALSALLGASGNQKIYHSYLNELGAAAARDDIFAVSAYCPITNLDNAVGGVNYEIAQHLGLQDVDFLEPLGRGDQPAGSGLVGNLPQALKRQDLLNLLKSTYGRTELPVVEAKPKDSYQRIALIGGSGTQPEYIQAAAQSQADVFLTGDISYHRAQLCYQEDMMTVDVGHYVESIFKEKMPAFLTQLAQEQGFDYQVIPSQASTNPFRYE